MASEASHSDDARCSSYREIDDPSLGDLLGSNRLLGVVERSEAMEIAVNTNILVK